MFTFIKQNKLFVIVAILFVLGVSYYAFSSSGSGPASTLTTSGNDDVSAASQQLLVVLANLRTIRLDDSIFKDQVFLSLTDYGVVISPENVGRRNPFAPFSSTTPNQPVINTAPVPPVSGSIPVKQPQGANPPTPRVRVFPLQ